jgi:hypothetical protein
MRGLIFCLYFGVNLGLNAQILEQKLSFVCKDLPIQQAIDSLSRQAKVSINYRSDLLDLQRKVSLQINDKSLLYVLNEICASPNLSYEVEGKMIILKKQKAKSSFVVNGKVRNQKTGELLIGAGVYVSEIANGTSTNSYGFFALNLIEGEYNLTVRSLGYKSRQFPLYVRSDLNLEIGLEEEEIQLAEVEVETSSDVEEGVYIKEQRSGMILLNYDLMKKISNFLGEFDPLRAVTLFPGISKGNEISAGLFVRGGNADQNLILLDEAPLYNATHVLGLFSIFNPDAVKDMELFKSNIPANYGGRLSSVLDVRLKEGNREKTTISGGLGTLSARLSLEQPLFKGKGSLMVSARRSLIDYFTFNIPLIAFNQSAIAFGDLSFKAGYQISSKDKIMFSAYFGNDFIGFQDLYSTTWSNALSTLRWNHLFSPRMFCNTTLYTSNFFSSNTNVQFPQQGFEQRYRFSDFGVKQDYSFFYSNDLNARLGWEAIYHGYFFGEIRPTELSFVNFRNTVPQNAIETAAYFSLDQSISPRVQLMYGLRFSRFDNILPSQIYLYADSVSQPGRYSVESMVDTLNRKGWGSFNFYQGFEPRFSVRYLMGNMYSIKASYNRNRQYIHQLSTTNTPSPLDMWAPSSTYIRPQIGDQFSLGLFWTKNNKWDASVEVFGKYMRDILDFKPGANLLLNDHIETEVSPSIGRAAGLEFFLRKQKGKLTGWMSYTASRTERLNQAINSGRWYPAAFDRLHQANFVISYQIHPRISLSANWIYASGQAYTFPVAKYQKDGFVVPFYTDRNTYRLPDNHRLDISATFFRRSGKKVKNNSTFNLSIYNLYARQNAFGYVFRQSKTDPNQTETIKMWLFGIVPSFSYNFKF